MSAHALTELTYGQALDFFHANYSGLPLRTRHPETPCDASRVLDNRKATYIFGSMTPAGPTAPPYTSVESPRTLLGGLALINKLQKPCLPGKRILPVAYSARRLYNFSLNTKNTSKQISRSPYQKDVQEEQVIEEGQPAAEKVSPFLMIRE